MFFEMISTVSQRSNLCKIIYIIFYQVDSFEKIYFLEIPGVVRFIQKQFSLTKLPFYLRLSRSVKKYYRITAMVSLRAIFYQYRVFAMKSVQNLKSFWRSSQNYFVLALFCSLHFRSKQRRLVLCKPANIEHCFVL